MITEILQVMLVSIISRLLTICSEHQIILSLSVSVISNWVQRNDWR